jgi:hypothetical protein
MAEFSQVELAVNDHDGLASPYKYRAEMGVGVKRVGLAFAVGQAEFRSLWTWVHVLAFLAAGGDNSFENISHILLEEFEPGISLVEGTFLGHYRTGGMMRINHADPIFDTRMIYDPLHFPGDTEEVRPLAFGTNC